MDSSGKRNLWGKFSWQQSALYLLLLLMGLGGGFVVHRTLSSSRFFWESGETTMPKINRPFSLSTGTPESSEQGNVSANPIPANFIVQAVDRVGAAVVRINAARTVSSEPAPFNDPFFGRFFGIPTQPQERVERGTGSGFIISDDGQILTNAHVVNGTDTVQVILKDGRIFDGKVLGQDAVTDVAVVKIEETNLPKVTLGDSEHLQPGEWAIAIGNPLGLDNTVTAGIISATGRSLDTGKGYSMEDLIQTDAAINQGNSGGPLVNLNGEIVGINTLIVRGGMGTTTVAEGLGFAIPSNTVRLISEQIITKGYFSRPYLGITWQGITPNIARRYQLPVEWGAYVTGVEPGSPADHGGIKRGDIIVQIGDLEINQQRSYLNALFAQQPGETITIKLYRQKNIVELSVTLGASR